MKELFVLVFILAASFLPIKKGEKISPYEQEINYSQLGFQSKRWYEAKIRPEYNLALDKIIARTLQNRSRYETVEKMRSNGVPWFVVAGLHERESTQSFNKHLHEGSPLQFRTKYIPKDRLPPPKNPPYTWEESSEDALYILKSLHKINWKDLEVALQNIEAYNGLGYQKYHKDVNSPYLYSFTTLYERGKYVADGKFSAIAVDKQAGVVAILKRMNDRGIIKYYK